MLCRIYFVRGRVQGVGFRNFALRCATRIGVAGYTRNLSDGRVEVLAQGSAVQLSELEAELRQGPKWAEVAGVESEKTNVRALKEFVIRD